MRHRERHPAPVDGCDLCRWASVGVAGHRIRQGADPVRRVPVTREEGPLRGTVGGHLTQHMDGRQDATVTPPVVRVRTAVHEEM